MSSQPARTRAPRQPKPLPRPRAAVPPHEAEEQEQLPECFSRKISAEELRANLDELRLALRAEAALTPERSAEVGALIDSIAAQDALDAEADYVQLFDSGRRTSLHLFEHVHGD